MYILYLISPNFCAINDAIGCCYTTDYGSILIVGISTTTPFYRIYHYT